MKILFVEDNKELSSFVRIGFEKNNYIIDTAFDGAHGEKLAMSKSYDVIILDVMLPDTTGFEICKKIRNNNIKTPIIILTSLDSTDDKVMGFDCGADDYLLKPFEFKELHARVKALDRRKNNTVVIPVLKIADLEVDTISKKVKRADKEIALTAREYRILELLLSNRDKVFERIEIAEKIWGMTFNSGTNVIDVHINSLRNKIDKDHPVKLIHTIIGMGYVINEGK